MISIIIPTIKDRYEIETQVKAIEVSMTTKDFEIITVCCKKSSSCNRNEGLYRSSGEYVIFNDDDIEGYYNGWASELIEPLKKNIDVKIVSARLMNANGTPGTMISFRGSNNIEQDFWIFPRPLVPSACMAFRRNDWLAIKENPELFDNKPFDENYILACAEDSDFSMAMKATFPDAIMGVNNNVKIIHKNLEVWRTKNAEDWRQNHRLFEKKWGQPCH